VTTLAICLLHAYLNPVHEKRWPRCREEAPRLAVTLSHEVSPTFREYERTSTTVVNAYVMTPCALPAWPGRALGERGYRGGSSSCSLGRRGDREAWSVYPCG